MNGISSTLVTQLPPIPAVGVNPKLTPNPIGLSTGLNSEQASYPVLHFQSPLKASPPEGGGERDGRTSEPVCEKQQIEVPALMSMDQSTRRRIRHVPKHEPLSQSTATTTSSTTSATIATTTTATAIVNSTSDDKMKVPVKDPTLKVETTSKENQSVQKKTDPLLEKHEKPAKWFVGDLIWSKVSGHPWWPCLIACDPLEGIYTKLCVKGKGSVRNYHVQYFYDEPERAWVSENATLGFEGKDKFFKYVEDMLERAPAKQRSQISQKYGVSKHKRPVWDRAVRSAEVALPLSHSERKLCYINNFDKHLEKKKQESPEKLAVEVSKPEKAGPKAKKQKTESSSSAGVTSGGDGGGKVKIESSASKLPSIVNGTLAKKRHVSSGSFTNDSDNIVSPQRKRPKAAGGAESGGGAAGGSGCVTTPKSGKDDGSFDMFCQKHREGVLSEHSDFDEQMVVEYLRQQWSMMSQKQRARYKSKFGGGGVGGGGGGGVITSRGTSSEEPEVKLEPINVDIINFKKGSAVKKPTSHPSRPALKKSESDEQTPSKNEVKLKRSPRISKPSIKKLEAEEDNKLFTEYQKQMMSGSVMDNDQTQDEIALHKGASTACCPSAAAGRRSCTVAIDNRTNNILNVTPSSSAINSKPNSTRKRRSVQSKGFGSKMFQDSSSLAEHHQMNSSSNSIDGHGKSAEFRHASSHQRGQLIPKVELDRDGVKLFVKQEENNEEEGHEEDDEEEEGEEEEEEEDDDDDDDEYELEIFKLSSSWPVKRENVCQICEKPGDLTDCEGPCLGSYHLHCLDMTQQPSSPFKCVQCTTNSHRCFCCKQTGDVKKCSVVQCGRFYHDVCVRKHPLTRAESKSFTCPLHVCVTCSADSNSSKNPKASKGRLCRCLRCPTAYHVGDFCIGAGSVTLAGNNIICSNHFVPPKNKKTPTHFNVSWCFICNLGGTLLCCDSCPAAFHPDCINVNCSEDTWYCQDCARGKKPLYGDIVWVKVGNYRWWPGEICHPKNVPMNIQQKPHQIGEFPVRFFGSHDYYWTNQARVFLFQEGDKGSKDSSATKGLAKIFRAGIGEATEAFKLWKAAKENRDQLENEKIGKKPAPFKFVKTNLAVGNVQIHKADLSEIPRCECRPDMDNPCGSDTECLNRMLMYECHPQVCPAGERCQNQRFTKRLYPDSVPAKTSTRGWGLKTNVDIKKGQFVNEYVGDLIDEEECKKRIWKAHEDNISNFYMLTLDKNRIIDAGPKGNLSRFMNHSCQPNCETQKWMVNGDVRVGLFSLHDIPANSELTFNYNLDCLGNEKKICACGAPNCSGFLGVRPKSVINQADKKAKDMKKKKKRKKGRPDLKKHEDECFRCGEGGELVMCDKSQCPKVYHLQCLSLTKPPHGRWTCPWHHCDVCGKQSMKLCSDCPNSFCTAHSENNIHTVEGRDVCYDHEEIVLEQSSKFKNGLKQPAKNKVLSNGIGPLSEKREVASVDGTCNDTVKSTKATGAVNAKLETHLNENTKLNKAAVTTNGERSVKACGKRSRRGRDDKGVKGVAIEGSKNFSSSSSSGVGQVDGKKTENNSLAIPPMFDDSDDEFPGLVIDLPPL